MYNGGLNFTTALQKFTITGSGSDKLSVKGSALIEDGRLVSAAPKGTTGKFTIPSTVTEIESYAFYGIEAMNSVSIPYSVKKIGNFAFSKSGLNTVKLPEALETIGKSVFESCGALSSVSFTAAKTNIPVRFAAESPSLKTVTTVNPILSVDESAFKNCSSLSSLPFSGSTVMDADSIFFGCGFEEVVFDDSKYSGEWYREQFLAANKDLVKIDATAMKVDPDDKFTIGPAFAPYCLKLKEIRFPDYATFWSYADETGMPVFGYTCAVEKIVCHTLTGSGGNEKEFLYSPVNGVRDVYPRLFAAQTRNKDAYPNGYNQLSLSGLFSATNGANVYPSVYVDTYEPYNDSFVADGISYFVPGGCRDNYSAALDEGNSVKEFYTISFTPVNAYLRVDIIPVNDAKIPAFKLKGISYNGEPQISFGAASYMISTIPRKEIKSVRIFYTLDDVEMQTEYPAKNWMSSEIDDITSNNEGISRDGDLFIFNDGNCEYSIATVDGRIIISGNADSVDISSLPTGVYILSKSGINGSDSIKFIR